MSKASICVVPAGLPLTDAELSNSYTVLTVHAPHKNDWAKSAHLDTLVLLMAGNALRDVMQCLLAASWEPNTSVRPMHEHHWNCENRKEKSTMLGIIAGASV